MSSSQQEGPRPGDRSQVEEDEEFLRDAIWDDASASNDGHHDEDEREEEENLQAALLASVRDQLIGNEYSYFIILTL